MSEEIKKVIEGEQKHNNWSTDLSVFLKNETLLYEYLDFVEVQNYNYGDIIFIRENMDSVDLNKLKNEIFNVELKIHNGDCMNKRLEDKIENYKNIKLYCKRKVITTFYEYKNKFNSLIILTNIEEEKIIENLIDRHIKTYNDEELTRNIYLLRNIKEINNIDCSIKATSDNIKNTYMTIEEFNKTLEKAINTQICIRKNI